MQPTKPITAKKIEATGEELVICLDGREVRIGWEQCSPRLARATARQRRCAELSPGGYGVHWPLIDEDLTIGGLIRRRHDNPQGR